MKAHKQPVWWCTPVTSVLRRRTQDSWEHKARLVSQQHNKKSPGWASVLLVLRAWYWGWEEEKLSTAVSRPVCLQLDPQSPGDHAEM